MPNHRRYRCDTEKPPQSQEKKKENDCKSTWECSHADFSCASSLSRAFPTEKSDRFPPLEEREESSPRLFPLAKKREEQLAFASADDPSMGIYSRRIDPFFFFFALPLPPTKTTRSNTARSLRSVRTRRRSGDFHFAHGGSGNFPYVHLYIGIDNLLFRTHKSLCSRHLQNCIQIYSTCMNMEYKSFRLSKTFSILTTVKLEKDKAPKPILPHFLSHFPTAEVQARSSPMASLFIQ